jgi:hypothetical protein
MAKMALSLFSDSVTQIVQQKCHLDLGDRSSIIGFTPKEGEQGSFQRDPARLLFLGLCHLARVMAFFPWV